MTKHYLPLIRSADFVTLQVLASEWPQPHILALDCIFTISQMYSLLKKLRGFWIFSRILLAVIFSVTMINGDYLNRLTNSSRIPGLLIMFVIIIYILSLFFVLINELKRKVNVLPIAWYFAGGFSALFGILISFLIITSVGFEAQTLPMYLMPLWMLLFGTYDILTPKNTI